MGRLHQWAIHPAATWEQGPETFLGAGRRRTDCHKKAQGAMEGWRTKKQHIVSKASSTIFPARWIVGTFAFPGNNYAIFSFFIIQFVTGCLRRLSTIGFKQIWPQTLLHMWFRTSGPAEAAFNACQQRVSSCFHPCIRCPSARRKQIQTRKLQPYLYALHLLGGAGRRDVVPLEAEHSALLVAHSRHRRAASIGTSHP